MSIEIHPSGEIFHLDKLLLSQVKYIDLKRGVHMTVRQFMNSKIVTVATGTLLPQVWELITEKHIHGLPVVDTKGKFLGFISKEDMLAKLFPESESEEGLMSDTDEDIEERLEKLKKVTVDKVMKKEVFFTRADTNVMRALSRMIVRKVRQLPVLDDDDRHVGMISKADIFKGIFRR